MAAECEFCCGSGWITWDRKEMQCPACTMSEDRIWDCCRACAGIPTEILEANPHIIAASSTMFEALVECVTTMEHARVFVNTRERIKQPEGSDLYDEALAKASAALARARGDTP